MVRGGDIVTRLERDREELFDLLAAETGVGIGDNKIYFCNEIYCHDCKLNKICHNKALTHDEIVATMHHWLDDNFESQKEDIMDYLYLFLAVDNEFAYRDCRDIYCENCLFSEYRSCTKAKENWLKEEV